MKFGIVVAWYDFWIGFYWDRARRRLYVLPAPMFGFYAEWPAPTGMALVREIQKAQKHVHKRELKLD